MVRRSPFCSRHQRKQTTRDLLNTYYLLQTGNASAHSAGAWLASDSLTGIIIKCSHDMIVTDAIGPIFGTDFCQDGWPEVSPKTIARRGGERKRMCKSTCWCVNGSPGGAYPTSLHQTVDHSSSQTCGWRFAVGWESRVIQPPPIIRNTTATAAQRFTENPWRGKVKMRTQVPQDLWTANRILARVDKVQPSLEAKYTAPFRVRRRWGKCFRIRSESRDDNVSWTDHVRIRSENRDDNVSWTDQVENATFVAGAGSTVQTVNQS